jgi:hypothetical protein
MARTTQPAEPQKVECEVCLKEIPGSEARSAEAVGYVAYFCGLDCYERWKAGARGESRPDEDKGPA